MTPMPPEDLREQIISQIRHYGATSAGIARACDLKKSASYTEYVRNPYYPYFAGLPDWPEDAHTVLVFAATHKRSEPELDWWDPNPGGTPGNRSLMQMQRKMSGWLSETLQVKAHSLPYKIEEGGIFLKDCAVLAGMGIIGRNNLLLVPGYGASIRLRAMFLNIELEKAPPSQFNPCAGCDAPCFTACPQDAFRNGAYERVYCQIQMKQNEADIRPLPNDPATMHVRYCRACELACPAAWRGQESAK